MSHQPKSPVDLFEQHSRVLGLNREPMGSLDQEEATRIGAIQLTPLEEPPARVKDKETFKTIPLSLAYGLAAILVLAIGVGSSLFYRAVERDDDRWRIKGATNVLLYVKRGDKTRLFDKDMHLMNGDRLGVEVFATEPTTALMAVYNADGQMISDRHSLIAERQLIEPNKATLLDRSFELVGTNDHESLVVFMCDTGELAQDFPSIESFAQQLYDLPEFFVPESIAGICRSFIFALR